MPLVLEQNDFRSCDQNNPPEIVRLSFSLSEPDDAQLDEALTVSQESLDEIEECNNAQ